VVQLMLFGQPGPLRAAILIWVWTFLSRNPDLQERRRDSPRGCLHAFAPRLLVETDAPYLAPMPFRGKRNEPCFVVKTLEALASVLASLARG